MSTDALTGLAARRAGGWAEGVVSACSAHGLAIEAALLEARDGGGTALIEATCNQVNQDGGYTGLTPAAFRERVHGIADRVGLPRARLVLGGDHLGPNPWRHLPAGEAMAHAERMVEDYARAGYEKLHLDCSMGCAGEPAALDDGRAAERAAQLAAAASRVAAAPPVYVIGTEVPTPGGATEALDHVEPTRADAVRATYAVHEAAFARVAPEAWRSVLAIVVQPGVEFGDRDVAVYRPDRAAALVASLADLPGLVFEAHSTDYQPETALARLVEDGFAILKVGPELTFSLREALYGLDAIARALEPDAVPLADVLEAAMLADPTHWQTHYRGSEPERRALRHEGLSDRIRYYWTVPTVRDATDRLLAGTAARDLPLDLVARHLPRLHDRVAAGATAPRGRTLAIEAVRDVLRRYGRAIAARPIGGREP